MMRVIIKRWFDVIFSLAIIILLIPLWIIVPIAIKIDSPGRVIFKQKRVGRNSRYFTMYKFRSMKEGVPDLPAEEVEDHRKFYTRFGAFLRRFSLDELPQLFNVLKGDMGVVGPRPSHLGQHGQIKIRKEWGTDIMRPGLTSLAIVKGRDDLSISEKAEFDRQYVFESSLFIDIPIIIRTVHIVLTGRGSN
jgi:O-antigen biosynthesis protein WbqP